MNDALLNVLRSTVLLCMAMPAITAADDYPKIGTVHRFDDGLDRLLENGAAIEKLTEDTFKWSEGPVWIPGKNILLFSDVP